MLCDLLVARRGVHFDHVATTGVKDCNDNSIDYFGYAFEILFKWHALSYVYL